MTLHGRHEKDLGFGKQSGSKSMRTKENMNMWKRMVYFASSGLCVFVIAVCLCGCLKGPEADFQTDAVNGDAPLTVTFSDRSKAGLLPIQSWLWLFGDGSSSTEQTPVHVYATAGTYTVSLTVSNALGENTDLRVGFINVSGDGAPPADSPRVIKHVRVYYEPGRFGGWPANHGIWNWGNEILVGFTRGYYKDLGNLHNIDRDKPEEHLLARSLDGGEIWSIEYPAERGQLIPMGEFMFGTLLPGLSRPELRDCPGGVDFTHPDFAMTLRTTSVDAGQSFFYYSYDRGHEWEGPFRLPDFGAPGTAARTDYIVNGPQDCSIFITAAKSNGKEGRCLCARTYDGAATWEFQGWIGPEPWGFSIMPATVRLSDTDLFTVTRDHGWFTRWLSGYVSHDDGRTWALVNRPVDDTGIGNPATLTKLPDGRLALTYGYRGEPWSIRARISADNGATWSPDFFLRGDGMNRDIGYPRSIVRPDGKMVTVYYFCDPETNPDRHIAATIWDPGAP